MQEKIQFNQQDEETSQVDFQGKKQFQSEEVEIDPDIDDQPLEGELLENRFDQSMQRKSSLFVKVAAAVALLFLLATVAQSVQWLVDFWLAKQWIYFAFALVAFGVVGLGLTALLREFWRLRYLRRHILRQQASRQFNLALEKTKSAVQISPVLNDEQATQFCTEIAKSLAIDEQQPEFIRWKAQINPAHSGQEVALLFSQNVLQPIDKKAKKIVMKTAVESAVVVAVSPLAVVDMFFVAWRNIRLINQIAKLYGMELGYFSRLKLMKLVLLNMAFTGATELINDVGMDWLSQDLAAKLSARAAQGIGVGLLTARLGIKAIEFCRPMSFQSNEKLRLSHIQRELLAQVKENLLHKNLLKKGEKVSSSYEWHEDL